MLHRIYPKAVAVTDGNPVLVSSGQPPHHVAVLQVEVFQVEEVAPAEFRQGAHVVFPTSRFPIADGAAAGIPVFVLELLGPDAIL